LFNPNIDREGIEPLGTRLEEMNIERKFNYFLLDIISMESKEKIQSQPYEVQILDSSWSPHNNVNDVPRGIK
jgi:hypothetical protein